MTHQAAAFADLYRILHYLAIHSHRPIFYPRLLLTVVHELQARYDVPKFESITLLKLNISISIEMVHSDHARVNAIRRSHHCILSLLNNGVAIHWKMQQQNALRFIPKTVRFEKALTLKLLMATLILIISIRKNRTCKTWS